MNQEVEQINTVSNMVKDLEKSPSWVNYIEVIAFDLDNTLWSTPQVIKKAGDVVEEWLAEHYPKIQTTDELDPLAILKQLREKYPDLLHDVTALRKQNLYDRAIAAGYSAEESEKIKNEAFEVFWEERQKVELFPNVVSTLKRLQKKFRLGVITNGNASLDVIGLNEYFSFICTAEGVKTLKPDPKIFSIATEMANVDASKFVYIGDDPTIDMQGAIEAGLKTLWFNPDNTPWPFDSEPPLQVENWKEIQNFFLGKIEDEELV